MIQYILECIAFQLVFLIIYDFLLKKETFFQWNRVYLMGTYGLSLLLPWIKIEALRTAVPETYVYPEFLWNTNDLSATLVAADTSKFRLSWEVGMLFGGMFLALLFFAFKLVQLRQLRKAGTIRRFPNFTQVIVKNSGLAFSFFKSIFLGDQVVVREHGAIIKHELVHIQQRHSWDLLFFELMRIVAWFNPLVYIYQSRISEVHEFIADAQVAKSHKKEQYALLLSQVFQTQYISFINQFFKSSLIKKRIVMLQKSKSSQIWRLKYIVLLPLVFGMLAFTAMEIQEVEVVEEKQTRQELENGAAQETETVPFAVVDEVPVFPGCENDSDQRACFQQRMQRHIAKNFRYPEKAQIKGIQGRVNVMFTMSTEGAITNVRMRGPDPVLENEAARIISLLPQLKSGVHEGRKVNVPFSIPITFKLTGNRTKEKNEATNTMEYPFAIVDEVPVFPGCENEGNTRACFNAMMRKHISKHFNYPKEAREKGIQGRVNVLFTIATDGAITNVRMRGPDPVLEEEVARIISRLPKMGPGKQDGVAVNVPFSIPISFSLDNQSTLVGPVSTDGIELTDTGVRIKSKDGERPMYVINGAIADKESLEKLIPDAIESISVLKGEAATAKYGTAAKNGVIEVKTKKKN